MSSIHPSCTSITLPPPSVHLDSLKMAWAPVSSILDITPLPPTSPADNTIITTNKNSNDINNNNNLFIPPNVNKHDINFLLTPQRSIQHPPQTLNLPPLPQLPPLTPVSAPLVTSPMSSTSLTPSCNMCSYIAPTHEDLTLHIRTTHRIKPFACKVCDKTFAERGNANKHYRVAHLKQRNHRCQTCQRSFAFRDGLNRHISMVHLNQRPFECTECMCPKGPHPRTVPCTHICGMRFKQKSHRRRHVLSVHHAAGKRVTTEDGVYTPSVLAALPHNAADVS